MLPWNNVGEDITVSNTKYFCKNRYSDKYVSSKLLMQEKKYIILTFSRICADLPEKGNIY